MISFSWAVVVTQWTCRTTGLDGGSETASLEQRDHHRALKTSSGEVSLPPFNQASSKPASEWGDTRTASWSHTATQRSDSTPIFMGSVQGSSVPSCSRARTADRPPTDHLCACFQTSDRWADFIRYDSLDGFRSGVFLSEHPIICGCPNP